MRRLDRRRHLRLYPGVCAAQSRRRHLVPLAATQATGLLCGLIGVRWMSAVVPPALLGVYGVLLSTTQLGAVVTHQGFIKHVQRHWTARRPAAPYFQALVRAAFRPTMLMTAGLAGALALLHFLSGLPLDAGLLLWMVAVNLLIVVAQAAQAAVQAEDRFWANFAASAVGSATRSFLPPLLVMIVGASLCILGTGFLLHAVALAVTALFFLRGAWRRVGDAANEKDDALAHMVRAFAGVGACSWLAAAAPRWFAAAILPPETTGYFILAGNLTLIVPAAFGAIALSYSYPALFAAARAGADGRALLRTTNRTLAVVMIGSQLGLVALRLAAPWLIGPMIDARYTEATAWLLATGGAALAATTTQFYHNLLLAQNRNSDCLRLSMLSATLRLAAMGAGAAAGGPTFRLTLIVLPWCTLALEWWYTRRRLPMGPATRDTLITDGLDDPSGHRLAPDRAEIG